jgi:inner membrane transporter RhtA
MASHPARAPETSGQPAAVGLVLAAVASLQFGSALAATLFDDVGPGGAVLLRLVFSAAILLLVWRPAVRGRSREDLALVALFGVVLAAMNSLFYLSIDRIPLGIAVTFEFVGPLGVAVATSRRRIDLLWVALAACGIGLLSGGDVEGLDPLGVAFALMAGGCWAAYILLGRRVGRAFPGGSGLALALVVGAICVLPYGLLASGGDLADPSAIGIGLAVAVLSSAIPYSLELEALRRMPASLFGVLMSLEPAAAALAGFLVLDQSLTGVEALAIALVIVASAGATRSARAVPVD